MRFCVCSSSTEAFGGAFEGVLGLRVEPGVDEADDEDPGEVLMDEFGEVEAPLLLFTGACFLGGCFGEGVETIPELGVLLKVSGGGWEKLLVVTGAVGVDTGVATTTEGVVGVVMMGVVVLLLLPSRSLTLRRTASNSRNSFSN